MHMAFKKVSSRAIKSAAQNILLDFRELPGLKDAKVVAMKPIYGHRGRSIAYYEAKFSSPDNQNNGYAILSATTADFPVVEFSHRGLTHYERFAGMTRRSDFKMVRFGPHYITAEDKEGNLLHEIGARPYIVPTELQKHVRDEAKSTKGEVKEIVTPQAVLDRKGKKGRPLAYKTFKQRFVRPPVNAEKVETSWTPRTKASCAYDYYWASGYGSHTYFTQIPKNTSPNTNDHASGCGATAWMNLFGWHDRNWTPNLLAGSQTVNNAYIENLTMACHDFIGTYEPWFTFDSDQGFTWPEDMPKGYDFARQYLNHACSYWYRYDWWDTDEEWVFEVARDVIRAGKPFIVGYFQDWHYAIGYGVAECRTHGWEDHSWIYIYPGWSTNDSQDKWIPKSTIFGIYGVYDVFPLVQFAYLENPQEIQLGVGGPQGANQLLSFTGTAVFNSAGGGGSSWIRDTISFDVGRSFTASQFKKAVVTASLASIANQSHAVNAGWAVDRASVERNPATGKPRVTLDYAVRDIDGHLLRAGYKVNVLASL
jgi:hypothetical protein